MPTYEYGCTKCGREFEVRQRISEAPLTICETCGGALKRLLSAAPFILKGEGWYVTDYPSESRKKAMESEKGGDKGDKGGDKAAKKESTTTSSETSSPSTSAPTTSTSGSAAPPAKTSSSTD